MDKILHQLIWQISHDLLGFMHPRWLFGISSINKSNVGGGQIQIQVQKQNIMADQVMEDLKKFNIEDWNEASKSGMKPRKIERMINGMSNHDI